MAQIFSMLSEFMNAIDNVLDAVVLMTIIL